MNLKSIKIIIGLLLCVVISKAQPYWDVNGNTNANTNPSIVGMTNANGYDLDFYTNGTAKMRLTSAGNLGLNTSTTAPYSLLSLYAGNLQMTNGTTSNANSSDGCSFGLSGSDLEIKQNETNSDISLYSASNTLRMIIKSNGHIGMGINLPSTKLEVRDGNGTQFRLSFGTNYYTDMSTSSGGHLVVSPNANGATGSVLLGGITSPAVSTPLDIETSLGTGAYIKSTHSSGVGVDVITTDAGSLGIRVDAGRWGVVSTVNATAATSNYAVEGFANSTGPNNNYGVYGNASGATANWGVYGTAVTPNFAVYANGDAGGTTIWNPSDGILKTGVVDLNDAMSIIDQLHPRTFYFDTTNYSFMNLPSVLQYGFIAEEVQPVCPNLIKQIIYPEQQDADGNTTHDAFEVSFMNYIGYIPVMVQALKEQQARIEDLQSQLDGCCGMGLRSSDPNNANSQSVNLITKVQIQLGNAAPNPNGGLTTIPFQLPQSVVKAEMVFTDLLGQEVNRVELGARGFSKIDVNTTNLEDGTYTYTLIADGRVIDTKQMVKQH